MHRKFQREEVSQLGNICAGNSSGAVEISCLRAVTENWGRLRTPDSSQFQFRSTLIKFQITMSSGVRSECLAFFASMTDLMRKLRVRKECDLGDDANGSLRWGTAESCPSAASVVLDQLRPPRLAVHHSKTDPMHDKSVAPFLLYRTSL